MDGNFPTMHFSPSMLPPEQYIEDRKVLWALLQEFWMDTDPDIALPAIAETCANSKYSMDDLARIFWNEVAPAVRFNLRRGPAPEWAGFETEWLAKRVLENHSYGKPLAIRWWRFEEKHWWRKLVHEISQLRIRNAAG